MFEGLGLGSRLASMKLPTQYNYVPICAAFLYGLTTPVGIAVGLGVHTTYNPDSTTASIVSGVLDALSAGILIYTGLVEVSTMACSRCSWVESDILFATVARP
jgi:zinc transporter 1/2/3